MTDTDFTIVTRKKHVTPKQTSKHKNNVPAQLPVQSSSSSSTQSPPLQSTHVDTFVPSVTRTHNTHNTNNRQHERINDIRGVLANQTLNYYDPSVELDGNDMTLNSTWKIWIHDNNNTDWSVSSYEPIYQLGNVGEMWRFLNVFRNLNKMTHQFYIMRDGITPLWEDNNNKNGAICSLMLECVNRNTRETYENICVNAFIAICCLVFNESFASNNLDINGLCYSSKQRNALIKLWVKDFQNNRNFMDKLPLSLLHSMSNAIDDECNFKKTKAQGSRISVQIKQIVPSY